MRVSLLGHIGLGHRLHPLSIDRPAFPEEIVRDRGLTAQGAYQGGDLSAVIPRMSEELGEQVLDAIAVPATFQAAVVELACQLSLIQSAQITGPGDMHFIDQRFQLFEGDAGGKDHRGALCGDAEAGEPTPAGGAPRAERTTGGRSGARPKRWSHSQRAARMWPTKSMAF